MDETCSILLPLQVFGECKDTHKKLALQLALDRNSPTRKCNEIIFCTTIRRVAEKYEPYLYDSDMLG